MIYKYMYITVQFALHVQCISLWLKEGMNCLSELNTRPTKILKLCLTLQRFSKKIMIIMKCVGFFGGGVQLDNILYMNENVLFIHLGLPDG